MSDRILRETELYPAIKRLLETQGYVVKGEICGADVVGVRADETVVVELKRRFDLKLLLQGVDRTTVSDAVYVAAPAMGALVSDRKAAVRLCRMLGLGLLAVRPQNGAFGSVEILADPGPYAPRRNARKRARLLKEFERRSGDPTLGGSTARPTLTAYRQDALRCARWLAGAEGGVGRPADIKRAADVERAPGILQRDVYGWFERVERGVYRLSDAGRRALEIYADQLERL